MNDEILNYLYPKTAKEALAKWDAGETVSTIELGGLGPGYEQAIHILVFEIIRDQCDKPLPEEKDWDKWGDEAVHRSDSYGYSGAQVGQAKHLAYKTLKYGWREMMQKVPEDRRITISSHFPQPPKRQE